MFLDRLVRLAGLHHPPVVALVLLRQLAREEVEVRLADNLLQGPAQDLAELLVGEGEASLEVLAQDILRQRLDQRMVERLRIAQVLLRLPALRDVLDRAFVVKQPAPRIANGAAVLRNPDHRAVLAIDGRFEAA